MMPGPTRSRGSGRWVLAVLFATAFAGATANAHAQGSGEKDSDEPTKAPAAPEGESTDESEATEEGEESAEENEPAGDEAPSATEPEPLPPLDPNAQRPAPVLRPDVPDPPSRMLEVGPYFGYTLRPSRSDSVTYGPAATWGFYARPQVTSWLSMRLYYRQEVIPVTVHRGGYEMSDWPLGDTDFDQPSLRLRSFGARAEPTWIVNPRLRISGVIGLAWLRYVVPAPTSRGDLLIQTAPRAAVELNTSFGASVTVDLIQDWLAVGASVTHGVVTNRSGNAYDPVQAFADGGRLFLGPMPAFRSVTDFLLSLGVVL